MSDATLPECVASYDAELRARVRRLLHFRQEADVDDVMQETWLRAQRFWDKCRTARRAWLHAVMHSVAIMHLRKVRRYGKTFMHARAPRSGEEHERFDPGVDDMPESASKSTPADDAEVAEVCARVSEAVGGLSDRDQGLLVGHYLEDRPIRELADEIDVDECTARSALFRARENLRENLRDDLRSAAAARWARGLPL